MSKNDTFTGWASIGKDKPLVQMQFPLKAWDDNSVEMDITHCGICGSDVHTIDSGWGPTDYPCVAGHEIAGVVTRVGKNVTRVKVGDRAGLGPACGSCKQCHTCSNGEENVCMNGIVLTYNSHWSTGEKTYGGYADKWRGDETFICKIPDNVSNENASSFMCGGVTTYAPLRRWNVGPGSTLGVLGIGGLGHFAVMFGKALGATVIALSSSNRKRDVALELGCDDYVVTSNEEEMAKYANKLTHIICTGVGEDFKWETYFNLLVPNGIFINVNAPEFSYPPIPLFNQIFKQIAIVASAGGSVKDTEDMLQLISEKNLKAWYKKYPMSEVNKAIEDFRAGLPRFRFVLEN
ncbi:hypothetical protein RMATCC62417_01287 [Rhizopus microsporus]|nr:hypothetical protein RMATCC62417_01287 [Rhizopus microsporus]CEG64288.1 hypothetical protein RMATCC62417_01287 [Rhizopus microsporus]